MAGTPVAPNTQPQKDGDLLGTSNQDVQQVCVTLSIFLFLTLIVVTLPFPDCHHFRHPSHNTLCQEAAQPPNPEVQVPLTTNYVTVTSYLIGRNGRPRHPKTSNL